MLFSAFVSWRPGMRGDTCIKYVCPLLDGQQSFTYHIAWWGLIGGFTFLMLFSIRAGMAWWLAGLLFIVYFALSVSVTRLRAEFGFPAHSLWHATPYFILLPTMGSGKIDPKSSTIFALYRWVNLDWPAIRCCANSKASS